MNKTVNYFTEIAYEHPTRERCTRQVFRLCRDPFPLCTNLSTLTIEMNNISHLKALLFAHSSELFLVTILGFTLPENLENR